MFCETGGRAAAEWWEAYATAFDAAGKWARGRPSHAPFCYELMVTMLELASASDCGASGPGFVTDGKRRDKMLLALVAGCKKDSLRPTCVPLASSLLSALPARALSALLGEADQPIKALVQALLPRRLALAAEELEAIEALLLALGAAQPDAAFVLSLINDSLAGPAATVPASQRALYARVLQKLAGRSSGVIAPQRRSLLKLVRPILRAEGAAAAAAAESADMTAGSDASGGALGDSSGGGSVLAALGSPDLPPEHNGLLPAVLLCLPPLWPAAADLAVSTGGVEAEDEADLALIARLVQSVDRGICHAAFHCLEELMRRDRLRLTIPVLSAVGEPSQHTRARARAHTHTACAVDSRCARAT